MSKLVILTFIFCSIFALKLRAQPSEVVIPFELTEYNNILVDVTLNHRDTIQLMLHTAANAVTLTEEAVQRIETLKFDQKVDSVKSWGAAANSVRISTGNEIQMCALKWLDVELSEDKRSGQGSSGKFGLNLFKGKVVEIDFTNKVLIVSEKLSKKVNEYERLNLTLDRGMLFVSGECVIGSNSYPHDFLIHSGYAGAVLLDDEFVSRHALGGRIEITEEKELKDSFGNVLKTKEGLLPKFVMGKDTLTDVPVAFFEGAIGRQKISVMGGEILKKFNVIFDAKREYVYLKLY